MTDNKTAKLFQSEEFQLVNAAINLAVGKCQLMTAVGDRNEVHFAANWAKKYYDKALEMISNELKEMEETETNGGETLQLRDNLDTGGTDGVD
jgi:hypothetical protein